MERLTHKRENGIKTGYWSPSKKQDLVDRLASYENTGLDSEDIKVLVDDVIKVNQMLIQDWIPCSEKLPEETGYYLVQLKEKIVSEDYADRTVALYSGEDKCFMSYEKLIIAWQPLPEPYKLCKEGN